MSRSRTSERGAALLLVMVAVAVLTALAADLAYETQVSLRIAANARNELQATYLAKSGIAASRLVLAFQSELEAATSQASAIPGALSIPRPLLWRIAPVDSELVAGLFGGAPRATPEVVAGAATETAAAPGTAGPAPGAFQVAIDDEGQKVNAQLEGLSAALAAQVQAFWQLACDPKWDPLFDREDANGVRVSRGDLLINLKDWVDEDAASSALGPSFAPNGCAIGLLASPFEPGFGDENFAYDRGEDRYRTKNARMDSLDELYLVAGIGDTFMGAFVDQLTVYMKRDDKPNVNTTDPVTILRNAMRMAEPAELPKFLDPKLVEELVKTHLARTFLGRVAITPKDFSEIVKGLGIRVNESVVTGPSAAFGDKSTVFRLRSTGRAGDVTKTLDVVLRPDVIKQNVPMPGTIVHWREE